MTSGPGRFRVSVILGAAVAVALALAACGSDRAADGDGSASATTVTTPADPAARDAVRAGASPVIDLPAPPIDGMPVFVGNHGDDLVVVGGREFTRSGMERPSDDVAVLDAGTFSWRSYPRPPFDHPTGYPIAAVTGDVVLISGFSCEIGTETHDSSGPDCALGPRQTARLDLDSGRWTRLASPATPAEQTGPLGSVDADLFATPTGVLAAVPSVRVELAGRQRAWSFLATGSDRWVPVDAVSSAWGTSGGRLRITVTSGAGPMGSERGDAAPTLIVSATSMTVQRDPTAVVVVPFTRNENGALTGLKTTSYAENVVALRLARAVGAGEAVLANTAGELCEGTGSNVFVGRDGVLVTPPLSSGCLAGVTRALLLEAMAAAGQPAVEAALPVGALAGATEAFLVSTGRHVQPISHVDGVALPAAPGPLTERAARIWDRAYSDAVDP